jgi:3-hydroxyacyl-CoA dehydrogenase
MTTDAALKSDRAPAYGRGVAPLVCKAAVLGAGTMGSRIAAHLLNGGVQVVLLDVKTEGKAPSALASHHALTPATLTTTSPPWRIATG